MNNTRRLQVALYSHDSMGLGHFRRNWLIANHLIQRGLAGRVRLFTGLEQPYRFPSLPGVECIALPPLRKSLNGHYHPADPHDSLAALIGRRSQIIVQGVASCSPDLFICDNVPRGVHGELEAALVWMRRRATTRCVFGMRDILDAPQSTREEWRQRRNFTALRRFYDEIWVYGDQTFFDPVAEYRFPPDIAAKTRFTGYLRRDSASGYAGCLPDPALRAPELPRKYVLCKVGGGQDGVRVVEQFCRIVPPDGVEAVILTGPFFPETALRQVQDACAAPALRRRWLRFHPCPGALLRHAVAVVSMAGYNSVSEILSYRKPALLIPRIKPRLEQAERARRLAERGLAQVCDPRQLTPQRLQRWFSEVVAAPPKVVPDVDFDGFGRIETFVSALFEDQPSANRA